ncbi:MAG: cytochrome c, partial [Planctomycetaceae bacterium]
LKHGRQLYMEHCMHCHGVSGDGSGPTARYLNPLPRDYRKGVFKFTSTKKDLKPNRDDLKRTIKLGIPGTYMPSFMLLTDKELQSVTEYVRWLALRGELELKLLSLLPDYSNSKQARKLREKARSAQGEASQTRSEQEDELEATLKQFLTSQGEFDDSGFREGVDEEANFLVESWDRVAHGDNVIRPSAPRTPSSPVSIQRGRRLYLDKKLNCRNCHGDTGLGNGPQTRDYEKDATKPGLFDDWGHPLKPRNLTTGIYRGGRRPIDIYRRIRSGIKGAKMPAFDVNVASEQDVWDLVNYVLSIPLRDTANISQTDEHDHTRADASGD